MAENVLRPPLMDANASGMGNAAKTPACTDTVSRGAIYALVLLTAVNTLNFLDRGILNVLLEPIKAELVLSDALLGLISGFGFTIVYSLAGIPLARIADRGNRIWVLSAGVLFWSLMTAAGSLAKSGLDLAMARTGVGLGEAAGFAPSQAILSDSFPPSRRASALAIWSVGSPLGSFIGLSGGGFLAVHYGWRIALFAAGVPGMAFTVGVLLTLKDARRKRSREVDDSHGNGTLFAALRALLRNSSVSWTLLGSLCYAVAFSGLATWGPAFFHRVFSLNLQAIGLKLGAAYAVAGITGALGGAWMIARLSRRSPTWNAALPAAACILGCPCLVLFAFAPSVALSLTGVLAGLVFVNACVGPILSVYQVVAPAPLRAQVAALHTLIASIGLGLGPLLVGVMNDRLGTHLGETAIRWSMLSTVLWLIPAGACLIVASRHIDRDVHSK